MIFLPGFIFAILIDLLTTHKRWSPSTMVLYALLGGVFSYVFAQIIFTFIGCLKWVGVGVFDYYKLEIWNTLLSTNPKTNYVDLLYASFFGILLAICFAMAKQSGFISWLVLKLKITNKYGEESLFYHYLSRKDLSLVWVRDYVARRVYEGRLKDYSEDENKIELSLERVRVMSFKNPNSYYELPSIYLVFYGQSFAIEEIPRSYHYKTKEVQEDGEKQNNNTQ